MVLGLQNTLWRSKHVLEQLYHFGRRKVSAWRGLRRGGRGDNIIGELLAPKCTLEHLGSRAPWPAGCGPGRDRTFPGFLAGQEKYQVFYQVYYHVFSQVPNPRFSWFSMITNAFPQDTEAIVVQTSQVSCQALSLQGNIGFYLGFFYQVHYLVFTRFFPRLQSPTPGGDACRAAHGICFWPGPPEQRAGLWWLPGPP